MKIQFKLSEVLHLTQKHPHDAVTFIRVAKELCIIGHDFDRAAKLRGFQQQAEERAFTDLAARAIGKSKGFRARKSPAIQHSAAS